MGNNNAHEVKMKQMEMDRQKADRAHEQQQADAERAHELTKQREAQQAKERAAKLAKQAKDAEIKERLARQKQQDEHKQYLKRLENEEKAKKRKHEEEEAIRKRKHAKELEKIELEKKAKQKEIEAQKQKHEEDLKKMVIDAKEKDRANKEKQRNESIQRIKSTIDALSSQVDKDKEELMTVIKSRKSVEEKLIIEDKSIEFFNADEKLKEEKKEMEAAHKEWKQSDDDIQAAINKTGQDEDNVGRFLRLTHALIGQTTATQANANKLDAELSTFHTLIERECQDKLTIPYYFKENNLGRFAPILAKQGFKDCQNMICDTEEEFKEDILGYLEEEVEKEIDEWKKRHPNEQDPFEVFLESYRLQKFKKGLKDAGLESLDDINEDLEDEDIEELISEAGIKGLNKKKFKRAVKDVQSGKYQPPEPESEPETEPAPEMTIAKEESEGKDTTATADDDEKGSGAQEKKVKKEQKKKDERPRDISKSERRDLRKICLKPDTWKPFEKEKADLTKEALKEITPILGGFFDKMHGAVKQAQKLLEVPASSQDSALNDKQQEAMDALMDNSNQKAILSPRADKEKDEESKDEEPKDDESKDGAAEATADSPIIEEPGDNTAPDVGDTANPTDIDEEEIKDVDVDPKHLPDYEQRKAWLEASEVQVQSATQDKWYNGKIIKIIKDEEGEWLEIEYKTDKDKRTKQVDRYGKDVRDPVSTECRAITAAIMVDIDIVSVMRDEFQVSETTKRALPVATGVEESVRAIMVCQSQIRQSVRLAGSLLNLKPANLTDESKPLWDSVDDGIMHILKSALEMSKISAQYFGYFLRFNQSFQRFISMNEQNKDVTLFTSLEHIKQDITEFSDFKREFNKRLSDLSAEAIRVIQNCVMTHMGAEQFERSRIVREQSQKKYLEKKEIYDKKSLKLDKELKYLCMERASDVSIETKLKYRQDILSKAIERNQGFIEEYRVKETELLALNFDTFEDDK